MNIVISGGSGFLGQALATSLHKQGHTISIISRSKQPNIAYNTVTWDNAQALEEALTNAQVIYNFAGANVAAGLWTDKRKAVLRNSRISSTNALVQALPKDGEQRVLVSMSASGYYGDSYTKCTETAKPGDDFLAQLCVEWEEAALRAQNKARVVMVRTGIPMHPDGGVLEKLLPLFRLYLGGHVGSGKQWFPWIHLDDAVRAYEFVGTNEHVNGAVNIVSPDSVTLAEFCRQLGSTIRRPSYLHAPEFVVRLAGEVSSIILNSNYVVPKVLQDSGFEFSYPRLADALQDLLVHRDQTA